jgi:hypothetical protein
MVMTPSWSTSWVSVTGLVKRTAAVVAVAWCAGSISSIGDSSMRGSCGVGCGVVFVGQGVSAGQQEDAGGMV